MDNKIQNIKVNMSHWNKQPHLHMGLHLSCVSGPIRLRTRSTLGCVEVNTNVQLQNHETDYIAHILME